MVIPRLALLGLLTCIVLVGCSGSSSGKTPTADPTLTASANTPFAGGSGSTPSSAPVITAPQGLSVPDIVEQLAPSVVRVQTEGATLDAFGRVVPGGGVGSGVIIDGDGHIVTNNHVVTVGARAANSITVTLSDQRTAKATLVGRDEPTDLAVLKIESGGLRPAQFGSAGELKVGQDVVAIGFALDLRGGPSVTRGVLSATGRSIQEQPYTINDAIQTDASINPGNSGGPLVDALGRVIGINTAIVQGAQNIGFAISVGLVQPTVNALITSGKIERAFFGVSSADVTQSVANNFDLPVDHGIVVTSVGQDSPAQRAGIRQDDVIVAIDGHDVNNNGDLLSVLARHAPGDTVEVELYRGNDQQRVSVALGARPGG